MLLTNVAKEQSFSKLDRFVTALSCPHRLLKAKYPEMDENGFRGFTAQLKSWQIGIRKEKSCNNALLRVSEKHSFNEMWFVDVVCLGVPI